MITQVTSIEELKEIIGEIFFDKTNRVTKISEASVLNAIFYGCAKVAQKTLKDISLIEGQLFADYAFGIYLDLVAQRQGIAARFGAAQSSTYVRIVGDAGTTYTPGTHTFTGSPGIAFNLENAFTIPADGFGYAKIRSQTSGLSTNVGPLTLNKVNPVPAGHKYCINEYKGLGGRDAESDDVFRKRIKDGPNILARGTLAYIEQAFMKVNQNVLRVLHQGFNSKGQVILGIITENGIDLTNPELDAILQGTKDFFSLTEMKPSGTNTFGIQLRNVDWYPIDVMMRLIVDPSFDIDILRTTMQIEYAKNMDYRLIEDRVTIEWDNLLELSKRTPGVKYVYDNYFTLTVYNGITPIVTNKTDLPVPRNKIPRIQGFTLLDQNGQLIVNTSGTLNPFYYPRVVDAAFASTVLTTV